MYRGNSVFRRGLVFRAVKLGRNFASLPARLFIIGYRSWIARTMTQTISIKVNSKVYLTPASFVTIPVAQRRQTIRISLPESEPLVDIFKMKHLPFSPPDETNKPANIASAFASKRSHFPKVAGCCMKINYIALFSRRNREKSNAEGILSLRKEEKRTTGLFFRFSTWYTTRLESTRLTSERIDVFISELFEIFTGD